MFLIFQMLGLLFVPFANAKIKPALSAQVVQQDGKSYSQVMPLDGTNPKRILFRGALPSDEDFEELQTLGVKTVLNLQSSDEPVVPLEDFGFRALNVPLPALMLRPPAAEMSEIVEILQDARSYPLMVHCRFGKDRTGLVVALYRVLIEGVSPEIAYQEMLTNGFHRHAQLGLKCAFFEALDLPQPKRCALIPRRKLKLNFGE